MQRMRPARDLVHRGGRQVISSRAENTRDRKANPILKEKDMISVFIQNQNKTQPER